MAKGLGIIDLFKYFRDADDERYTQELGQNTLSITAPKLDDGAREIEVTAGQYNAFHQQTFDGYDAQATNTKEIIDTYRGLVTHYEVENAVQEIVSDAIVNEVGHESVSINLESTSFSDNIQTKILEEFKIVLNLLNFRRKGSDHFRRWYVDSRVYFHQIIDIEHPDEGIKELRRLDPRNVQFFREIETDLGPNGIKIVKGHKNFFLYDSSHESYACGKQYFAPGTKIKIPYSAMVYSHSGLTDCCGTNIIGYLHRAVKPANQLKMLEDAMVIYRITRAPDRRVFYIDTGNMPSKVAAKHMQNIINSHRNKVVYDSATGKVKNQQNILSVTQDYWLQRRDGKAVTEVDTLPGMTGMNEMDDILYFRKALYLALRVPLSRIPDAQNSSLFDAGTAISRDELQFNRFIGDLQHKFEEIFLVPLKTNLILKKVITEEEWDDNINNIDINFHKDSYFTELKDIELLERRLNSLQLADPYIGKYISHDDAMKSILQMSEEDIKVQQEKIKTELTNQIFNPKDTEENF